MQQNRIIRKALGLTYTEYDNARSSFFASWCQHYANVLAIPQRLLITNEVLYNWFCDQWYCHVESAFFKDCQDYLKANIDDKAHLQDLFLGYTDVLKDYYPKAILNKISNIKKQTNKNEQDASFHKNRGTM